MIAAGDPAAAVGYTAAAAACHASAVASHAVVVLGFMQHVVTAIRAPPPQPSPQLGQTTTTLMSPALQPPAQYASPIEQVSQWFASLVPAPQFTPFQTGFTPTKTSL